MSETKKPRTMQELQGEYQGLCTKAGDLQYKIWALKKDLELVNDTLRNINFEAVESQNQAAKDVEAAKAAEAAKVVPIEQGKA